MKIVLAFLAGGLVAAGLVLGIWAWKSTGNPELASSQIPPAAPDAAPPPAVEAPAAEASPQPSVPVAAPAAPVPAARPRPRAAQPSQTPSPAPPAAAPVAPASPTEPEARLERQPVQAEPAPPPPLPRVPRTVTLTDGTLLRIRLMEPISTETHKPGDTFAATLDRELVVEGLVIAERGARVQGEVATSTQSGRVKGLAQLGLVLTQFVSSDGQKISIRTAEFTKEAEKSTGRDAAKVGLGAAIGSAIGAIAGGGKGAAIGAAAGAGAGTGAVLATRGQAAELPTETRLTFRLNGAVPVTEQLK